jgi:segregation and condensation protein A
MIADDTPEAPTAMTDAWQAPSGEDAPLAHEALVVDVDGFEGPLDLLLALARTHKLDITRLSLLALVDQYLAFIRDAQNLRIEIAADYLVMAAWLAYLKSRLLLPKEAGNEELIGAEEAAQRLAFRLMRLEAMRRAAAELMTRKRLGRDVFQRGMRETYQTVRETRYSADIVDLLKAYADQRRRTLKVSHVVKARKVWSIKEARLRLEHLVGENVGRWMQLDFFMQQYLPSLEVAKTVKASSFGATLEMAREGLIELRQDAPFAPIYMRRREPGADWERL